MLGWGIQVLSQYPTYPHEHNVLYVPLIIRAKYKIGVQSTDRAKVQPKSKVEWYQTALDST